MPCTGPHQSSWPLQHSQKLMQTVPFTPRRKAGLVYRKVVIGNHFGPFRENKACFVRRKVGVGYHFGRPSGIKACFAHRKVVVGNRFDPAVLCHRAIASTH